MSELKTCENCGKEYEENVNGNWKFCNMCILKHEAVDLLTLKAEAVKWVKSRREQLNLENIGFEDGIVKWIKHFFNLTEEDLK